MTSEEATIKAGLEALFAGYPIDWGDSEDEKGGKITRAHREMFYPA